jgi:hypothetical protein
MTAAEHRRTDDPEGQIVERQRSIKRDAQWGAIRSGGAEIHPFDSDKTPTDAGARGAGAPATRRQKELIATKRAASFGKLEFQQCKRLADFLGGEVP